jgi:hypothetical protein
MKHNWPTREQWADMRQHPYWDSETGCPFSDRYSHHLSDYATPEEIDAAIDALENLWRQYGRKMRELKLKGSPLHRQPDEKQSAFLHRFCAMSKADMDVACEPDMLRAYRRNIKMALAMLREDCVADLWACDVGDARAIIAPFIERYKAAFAAARNEWNREMAQTPVDDAAWEKELRRRKQIEADDAAHPERFIHHV